MNLSSVVYLAQPSSLDMLVLVGEVRMQAGLHTIRLVKDCESQFVENGWANTYIFEARIVTKLRCIDMPHR